MTKTLKLPGPPRQFEDFWGETSVIKALQANLRGQTKHVLLAGPSGSGKTALATAYSQAALCLDRLPSGSACLKCESCQRFERPGQHPDYHELDCGKMGTKDEVLNLLDVKMAHHPLVSDVHVAFLDEAHALSPAGRDALLVAMGSTNEPVLFVLALIDPEILPVQVRDRCRVLRIEPPSEEEALGYLVHLCESSQVPYEVDALRLIAAYFRGYRALQEQLAKAADHAGSAGITTELVRTLLLRDRAQGILEYLRLSAASDLEAALTALRSLHLDADEKLKAIREVLRFLKLNHVGPALTPTLDSRLQMLLAKEDREAVITSLTDRAQELGTELRVLFDEILEFWIFMPPTIDDTVLEIQATRFHELIHAAREGDVPALPSPRDVAAEATFRSTRAKRKAPAWRRARALRLAGDWLDAAQVNTIYDASTFLPRYYGLTFNTRLQVRPSEYGATTDAGAAELMSDLAGELDLRFRKWAEKTGLPNRLHRITLFERDTNGIVSSMVFHLPPAFEDLFRRWIADWRSDANDAGAVPMPIIDVNQSKSARGAMKVHWSLVRHLWRGIDPSLVADGDEPLAERLRVPKSDRRPVGRFSRRRVILSQSINEGAREDAKNEGIGHVSAPADRAWDWLFNGWELSQHAEVDRVLQRCREQQNALRGSMGGAGDPLHRRGLDVRLKRQVFPNTYGVLFASRPWATAETKSTKQ